MDFKIQRRNSLSQEVDGIWNNLEEEEDTIIPHKVTVNECEMLRKVLANDKMNLYLPKSCRMMKQGQNFMSRLSHLNETPDIAGNVSLNECKQLRVRLSVENGGSTFLPMSCSKMLKHDEELERDRMEDQQLRRDISQRRQQNFMLAPDFPPEA